MLPRRILSLLPSLLLLPAFAIGQDATVARTSHGVQVTPDGTWAGGPDYSARFDGRGVEFTPALGRAVAKALPVRFTLDTIRRGANDVFVRTADVAPAVDGDQVRYVHRGDLAEVYDVRADGIEQSFVFATKPAGSGDLVVRGRIATELPLAAASDDGVRYELPGLGGVTFGGVTGVDANGATARGWIRVAGDHLEWVLPAAFVENARYPLVLDPLIGSAISIGNSASGNDELPSVAFDASTSRYLVVWNVALSSTDAEVRGQLLSSSGALLGSSFVIETDGDAAVRPTAVNVNTTHRFLVAFKRNLQVTFPPATDIATYVRAVSPGTGAMSARVTVQTPGLLIGSAAEIVAAGDSRLGLFGVAQNALVVLRKYPALGSTDNRIVSFLVHVPATGDPTVSGPQDLVVTPNSIGEIAVTSHAGSAGRWLVVFGQGAGPAATFTYVMGQVVDDSGVLCGLPIPVQAGTTGVGRPAVATSNGSHFVVAWEDDAGLGIQLRTMTWNGTCGSGSMTLGATLDPTSAGLDSQPALEFAKDKYVIAWRRAFLTGGVPRVYVKGLAPDTCATCGTEWSVDNTFLGLTTPAIASHWSGGDTASDEALVVWSNTAIRGRRFEARSNDVVTAMGGGCSVSGFNDFATYNGDAVLGNANFELVLSSPVSLPLVMILGFSSLSAPCGSCTIVPTPDILMPATNPYPLAIPCDPLLVGVDLYTQWLLLKPSDCPILPDFAFSNALRFTIGE